MKKISLLALIIVHGGFGLVAHAITNCDNQAQPAIGCPPGYSMMCNPVGGDHWSCGKSAALIQGTGTAQPSKVLAPQEITSRTTVGATGTATSVKAQIKTLQVLTPGKATSTAPASFQVFRPRLVELVQTGQVTVRGWDPIQKKVVIGPADIATADDLQAYAQALVLQDPNIQDISVNGSTVMFTYPLPAKFLGIFKSTLKSQISVDSGSNEAQVKVKFPWMQFFFLKSVKADVIARDLSDQLTITDLQNAMQKQSQVMQVLSSILKKQHDTAMSIIQNSK